jgi:hypothetical protein
MNLRNWIGQPTTILGMGGFAFDIAKGLSEVAQGQTHDWSLLTGIAAASAVGLVVNDNTALRRDVGQAAADYTKMALTHTVNMAVAVKDAISILKDIQAGPANGGDPTASGEAADGSVLAAAAGSAVKSFLFLLGLGVTLAMITGHALAAGVGIASGATSGALVPLAIVAAVLAMVVCVRFASGQVRIAGRRFVRHMLILPPLLGPTLILSACNDPQQLQQALQAACKIDGVVVPIAQTQMATLVPASAGAVTIDELLIHPAVVKYCAGLGGTPTTAAPSTGAAAASGSTASVAPSVAPATTGN